MIELEIKLELKLDRPRKCEMCDDAATRRIFVGQVQYSLGEEYSVCSDPICEESAIDNRYEYLQDIQLHIRELRKTPAEYY